MFSRVSRPVAYFGPSVLFAVMLAGIACFPPEAQQISLPELPYWNFFAPESFQENSTREVVPDQAVIKDPFSDETDEQVLAGTVVPEPELNMIINGTSRPCCMINQKLYNLFEKGPGFTVTALGNTWVDLRMDNGSGIRLFLKGPKAHRILQEGQ